MKLKVHIGLHYVSKIKKMINLNELDEQSKSFFDLLNNNNNNNRKLTFEEITVGKTRKDPFEGI